MREKSYNNTTLITTSLLSWPIILIILANFFSYHKVGAQISSNLIRNAEFELYANCHLPTLLDTSRSNFQACLDWWTLTKDSDIHHFVDCNKHTQSRYFYPGVFWDTPNTGNGFINIFSIYDSVNNASHSSFMESQLLSTLDSGCLYKISFYAKPFGRRRVAAMVPYSGISDRLGIALSEKSLSGTSEKQLMNFDAILKVNFELSDTNSYKHFSTFFVANGPEEFISVGFWGAYEDGNLRRFDGKNRPIVNELYYVDDMVLELVPNIQISQSFPSDTTICFGENLSAPNYKGLQAVWSDNNRATIKVQKKGYYNYRIASKCHNLVDSIYIDFKRTSLTENIDTILCEDMSYDLPKPKFNQYFLKPNLTELTSITEAGLYNLLAVNTCLDTTYHTLRLQKANCDLKFITPTAYTPNGDGMNDSYQAYVRGAKKVKWTLSNRWGEILMHGSSDSEVKFNLGTVQEGVLLLSIRAEDRLSKVHEKNVTIKILK